MKELSAVGSDAVELGGFSDVMDGCYSCTVNIRFIPLQMSVMFSQMESNEPDLVQFWDPLVRSYSKSLHKYLLAQLAIRTAGLMATVEIVCSLMTAVMHTVIVAWCRLTAMTLELDLSCFVQLGSGNGDDDGALLCCICISFSIP